MSTNPYEILGVSKNASSDEIKKKYKSLAMKHHPDRNPDNKEEAEAKFKEITGAYDILSDPNKKAQYDNGGGPQFGGFGGFNSGFGDIFNQGFGFNGSQQTQHLDLAYRISISLNDVYTGLQKTINYRKNIVCPTCNGKGSEKPSDVIDCNNCNGSGVLIIQNGPFRMQQVCTACDGKGKTVKTPCPKCHRSGVILSTTSATIDIPKGILNGSSISVKNGGHSDNWGNCGDLRIDIIIDNKTQFEVQGHNLKCQVACDYDLLCLGGEIKVQTMDGEGNLKIAAGTQIGATMRIRGKGMPIMQSTGYGDLLCTLTCKIPTNLTENQVNLLEQFRNTFQTEA
jgi:molecular chaperone DnaJ